MENINPLEVLKSKIILNELDFIKDYLKNNETNRNIENVNEIEHKLDEEDISKLLLDCVFFNNKNIFFYLYKEHLFDTEFYYLYNIYNTIINKQDNDFFEYFLENNIFFEIEGFQIYFKENIIRNLYKYNYSLQINIINILTKYKKINNNDFKNIILTLVKYNLFFSKNIVEYIFKNHYNIKLLEEYYQELNDTLYNQKNNILNYYKFFKENGYEFSEKDISYFLELLISNNENNNDNDSENNNEDFLIYLIENESYDFTKIYTKKNKTLYHYAISYNIDLLEMLNKKHSIYELKDDSIFYTFIRNYLFNEKYYDILIQFIEKKDEMIDVNFIMRYMIDKFNMYDRIFNNQFIDEEENEELSFINNVIHFNKYNYYHKTLLLFIEKYNNINYEELIVLTSIININFHFFKFLFEKIDNLKNIEKYLFPVIMLSHQDALYNSKYLKSNKLKKINTDTINHYYQEIYSFLIENNININFYERYEINDIEDNEYNTFLNIKLLNHKLEHKDLNDNKNWIDFNNISYNKENILRYLYPVNDNNYVTDILHMNSTSAYYYKACFLTKKKKVDLSLIQIFFSLFYTDIDNFKFFVKKGLDISFEKIPKNNRYYKQPIEYFFKYLIKDYFNFLLLDITNIIQKKDFIENTIE